MAVYSEKLIAKQAVGSTTETLYTVPASTTIAVKDIHICNNSNTNCYVSLWLVDSGDSADDENVMFYQWNVPANDFVHWSGRQILETGGTIQAVAETADQITIHISGVTIV